MIMEEGQERVQAAYRDNYPRLTQIKAKYDPENIFHVNQNIHPGQDVNIGLDSFFSTLSILKTSITLTPRVAIL